MTPTKEALETGSSLADSEISQGKSRPKPESAHMRADAVSLEIPIKVHGSLVSNVAQGSEPHAQPFEEQTTTMIVFPQGGVLKMSTSVSAGQVMVLTNLKSRQDAICRVVKVRAFGQAQSYVEIEFTSPQPGYWGVYFPSDGPEVARMASPEAPAKPDADSATAPPTAPPLPTAETRAAEISWAPAASMSSPAAKPAEPPILAKAAEPAAVPPPPPPKPKLTESKFASIGTREDVQPAAASTKVSRANPSVEGSAKRPVSKDSDISEAIDALIAPVTSSARVPVGAEKTEIESTSQQDVRDKAPERSFSAPNLLGGSSEKALPTPRQMFGVALDSSAPVHEDSAKSSGSRMMIPIGIAALLALVAGGAYYYYGRSAANPAVASAPSASQAAPAATQPATAQNTVAPAVMPSANDAAQAIPAHSEAAGQAPATATNDTLRESQRESGSRPNALSTKNRESEISALRHEKSPSEAAIEASSPAKSQSNVAIPSMSGALNARPVINRNATVKSAGAAPALGPTGSPAPGEGALSGIAAPPPSLAAPPKPVPVGPVRVGGNILPPKLVSSVLPVYPPLAQQAGVTGTVVVDTTIDKEGHVAKMKVVSGPVLLREAALNALRQWRYEPSKLNGEPISVDMVVSIQFHR